MKNYRDGKYREAPQVLREKQINLLQEIKWICRKHDTDVKIIISPDYLQVNINPADVKTLKRFFGNGMYLISPVSTNTRKTSTIIMNRVIIGPHLGKG